MGNIIYPLIIWKIWIIHSISSYFLRSHYVCFGTGEGFTLGTLYEIWQRQFNKVVQIMFSALLVVNLRQVSQPFYTSVSSFAKRGWYPCSAMTVHVSHRLGVLNPTVCTAVIVCRCLPDFGACGSVHRHPFLYPTQALKLHIFRKVKPCFISLN